MKKDEMKPMSLVMEDLRQKGYACDFHMKDEDFVCSDTGETFQPEDLVIVQTYRFEGESDPGDMAILFSLESKSGTRGVCVDAYGTDASRRLGEFMKQVKIVERATE
jgi:hypothetical protein